MKTLFVFVDGFGLGQRSKDNPLCTMSLPGLLRLCAGHISDLSLGDVRIGEESCVKALDACLGVPGLPQSATGQVALFCGLNAPSLVGRHVNAYPTRELRQIMKQGSLLGRVSAAGLGVTFLNGYRSLDPSGQPIARHLSATTLAVKYAGLAFRTRDMVEKGEALTHDMTGEHINRLGQPADTITAKKAATIALRVAEKHSLTLFECFLTDWAGHQKRGVFAEDILKTVDEFFGELLRRASPDRLSVALCSDHGNIEDMGVKTHTKNPVPFALWGGPRQKRERLLESMTDISDVAGALETWIRWC